MTNYDIDEAKNVKGNSYTVPEYDIQSLNEIKKLIKTDGYIKAKDVREHLEFLEKTAGRLNKILANEQQAGMVDLDTSHFIKEVMQTYEKLYSIYEDIVEKLSDTHAEVKKKKKKSAMVTGLGKGSISGGMY